MKSLQSSHHHGSGAGRSDRGGSRSRRLRPGVELVSSSGRSCRPSRRLLRSIRMLLLDPTTLSKVLASKILSSTPPTGVTFSGGGYFYLNNDNQVVNVTTQGEIQIYSIGQGDDGQWEFKPVQQYNVKSALSQG